MFCFKRYLCACAPRWLFFSVVNGEPAGQAFWARICRSVLNGSFGFIQYPTSLVFLNGRDTSTVKNITFLFTSRKYLNLSDSNDERNNARDTFLDLLALPSDLQIWPPRPALPHIISSFSSVHNNQTSLPPSYYSLPFLWRIGDCFGPTEPVSAASTPSFPPHFPKRL